MRRYIQFNLAEPPRPTDIFTPYGIFHRTWKFYSTLTFVRSSSFHSENITSAFKNPLRSVQILANNQHRYKNFSKAH